MASIKMKIGKVHKEGVKQKLRPGEGFTGAEKVRMTKVLNEKITVRFRKGNQFVI